MAMCWAMIIARPIARLLPRYAVMALWRADEVATTDPATPMDTLAIYKFVILLAVDWLLIAAMEAVPMMKSAMKDLKTAIPTTTA